MTLNLTDEQHDNGPSGYIARTVMSLHRNTEELWKFWACYDGKYRLLVLEELRAIKEANTCLEWLIKSIENQDKEAA